MELNYKEILEYQNQVYPFLLIDHADEIIPGKSARGYKYLNMNDWFFKYHYHDNPVMPGLLIVEAIGQMAILAIVTLPGLKGKMTYLASVQKSKFFFQVRPANILNIEAEITKYTRGVANCKGVCKVNGNVACETEFTFIVEDVLNEYKVR